MSAVPGEDVVILARQWLGTPYCHRASSRGAGCDCLGLLRGIQRELQGAEPEPVPFYNPAWSEVDATERLWQALRRHLREMPDEAELSVGQILLFRMHARAAARHLGILSEHVVGGGLRFIHAYERHGVIESPLSTPWRRRIVARFELV